MAYWLVYQGNSWERSRAGEYLWAPQLGRRNQRQHYWTNMTRVKSGDLIFSGVDNAVRAVSLAEGEAFESDWPDPADQENWGREGWRLSVAYHDLPSPIPYSAWVPRFRKELSFRNSPFNMLGEPNQGFLYSLPNSVGEFLIDRGRQDGIDPALEAIQQAELPAAEATQKEAIIKARVGQGRFRTELLKRWEGKCPLSGVDRPELLRASHIKPWSSSNNSERLDVENGLLLSAAYDAAFDALLITFDQVGGIVLAPDFDKRAASCAGIDVLATVKGLSEGNVRYLRSHCELMNARVGIAS